MTQDVALPMELARIPETDDAPGDATTPFTITAGDRFAGLITEGDADWVAFEMVEGETYRFTARGVGGNPIIDPRLSLVTEDGTILNLDDDGDGRFGAEFVWTARVSGTFFLVVDGEGDTDPSFLQGRYALEVEDLTGSDRLVGGEGSDRVVAGDAGGLLSGLGGDDVLIGGAGVDDVNGRGGNDTLRGFGDSDVMTGGRGDDRMQGNTGQDRLFGNEGNDTIYGGRNADEIYGFDNADRLLGGDGSDVMNGGNGIDRVFGGAGDDEINGGHGLDFLRGGEGADTFSFRASSGRDVIGDFTAGEDTLNLRSSLFGGADLTVEEALTRVGTVVDGDSVFTFLNGATLTLRGVDFNDILDDVFIV